MISPIYSPNLMTELIPLSLSIWELNVIYDLLRTESNKVQKEGDYCAGSYNDSVIQLDKKITAIRQNVRQHS
jgi:hypothetical protein